MKHRSKLSIFILSLSSSAFSYTLPAVKVTAKKIEPLTFAKETVKYSDIEARQESTLIQVLSHMPAVQFTSYGGVGAPSQLSLQGGNPNHTLVTIDGISAEDPSIVNGAVNFAGFSADSFDELSLQKGPLSSVMGAGSLSGAINLETLRGKGSLTHHFSVATGSHGASRFTGKSTGSISRFSYNLHISRLATQGIRIKPERLRTVGRDFLTDKANLFTIRGRLDADLSDTVTFTWLPRYNDTHNAYNYYYPTLNPFMLGYTRTQQQVFRLTHILKLFEWSGEQELSYGFMHNHRRDREAQPPFLKIDSHNGASEHLNYKIGMENGGLKILSGALYQRNKMSVHTSQSVKQLILKKTDYRNSIFMAPSFEKAMGEHKIALKVAGRLDTHQGFGNHTSYATGVVYETPLKTKFSLSYGTGFKAPTLYQRFVNGDYVKGNPSLKPETMRGMQLSVIQDLPQNMSIEVLHFRHHIKQLIDSKTINNVSQYINDEKAYIDGIEEKIIWKPGNFKFSLAHSYTYTKNKQTQQSLRRRPKNGIIFEASYDDKDKWLAGMTLRYTTKPYDVDLLTSLTVEGKSTSSLDIYTNYKLSKHMDLFMRMDNVLNKKNEMPLGYLQPGFTALVGMKVAL